ncbi:MAG: hypothetical protein ACR2QK_21220 [Acidimicrobiales bacterium]
MRRLILLGGLGVAVTAGAIIFNPLALLPAPEAESGPAPRETAQVTVRDLERTFEADDGNIVFVGERAVTDARPGTIGWIVDPEQELAPGDVLYERDQQPVVLLAGDVPAWRTMGVDDVGTDVAQLEANLLALGYGDESEFTDDDTFTSTTAVIVERWQADLGVEQTGTVALGDVVFSGIVSGPTGGRVGSVAASVGDSTVGSTLLVLSTADRELVFTVGAESIGYISEGTVVSGRLPDRSSVEATVVDITPIGNGQSRVTARIVAADSVELPLGDAIPVTVSWTEVLSAEAVTVPAGAVIRLDRGGYAVEVVSDRAGTELVAVEVGAHFGTDVEILAGIEPDTTVIAP